MQAQAMAPTHEHVRAHDAAILAGFDGPRLARKVIGFVLANVAEEINLDDLARQADLSRFTFCRRFHAECGLPPMRWLWKHLTVYESSISINWWWFRVMLPTLALFIYTT